MRRYSLKTKISLIIAMIVLLNVGMISLLSNILINKQFQDYIKKEQEIQTQRTVANLSEQYDLMAKKWDIVALHAIGMSALYDGYMLKIYDLNNQVIWDAKSCDMQACVEIMNEVSVRMKGRYPEANGGFQIEDFQIMQSSQLVGRVEINYYGPYFLSQNDFDFLDALNIVLMLIGIVALIISIIIGWIMAKHLSKPILKAVHTTQKMANGNFATQISEKTDIRELYELIGAVNYLAESLNKQDKLRKQITIDVAHELRTPLTTIGTHLEAMIEGVWEPTSERLQSCYDENRRITSLVSDLESLAAVEREDLKLEKDQVHLLSLVQGVIDSFEIIVENKNLDVIIEGNCTPISADEKRIRQVFVNLVSNAIKYTLENGNITITLSETKEMVHIRVQDDGIGIKEEELSFIFERFYRADKSRNRMTGGAGIGLAIVKSIINAHEGTVKVCSKVNQGSCFEVNLPK